MTFHPTRDEFIAQAASATVVPVSVEVLADRETPVSVYEQLVGDEDGFLLESVEGGERWARWSFVGWKPHFTLLAHDGVVTATGPHPPDLPEGDPLAVLADVVARYRTPGPEAAGQTSKILGDPPPPLFAGAVGYLAYDAVRYIEHLPGKPPDDRGLPEMVWHFFSHLAIVDRFRQTVRLVRNVFVDGDPGAAWDAATVDLDAAVAGLGAGGGGTPGPRPEFTALPEVTANLTREQFEEAVRRSVEYVHAGDAFQIVPSVRFATPYGGDPFQVYRALRLVNPSPFMFFVRHGDVTIAGCSPELMSRLRDGLVTSRQIAGTRRRVATPDEDASLEVELLADPKELA
jgi:anthranilate synthase component 1